MDFVIKKSLALVYITKLVVMFWFSTTILNTISDYTDADGVRKKRRRSRRSWI